MKSSLLIAPLCGLLFLSTPEASAFDGPSAARVVAQVDSAVPTAAPAEAKPKPKSIRRKPRGRLPNNYGKLGVSDQQRETIYGIQSKYGKQLADLKKQIEEIESKRDGEIDDVLTSEQRAELKKIQAESEARRAARRQAAAEARAAKPNDR